MFFLQSADFFQIYFFKKLFLENYQSIPLQTVRTKIRPNNQEQSQNVGHDLDQKILTLMVFRNDYLKNLILKKNQQTTKNHAKLPNMQRVKETRSATLNIFRNFLFSF